MEIHSNILAWKIHKERSMVGYSPTGHKESETTEDIAWRIPRAEQPGGLQSMGSQSQARLTDEQDRKSVV